MKTTFLGFGVPAVVSDIRGEMAILPACIQFLLTWLTGIALPGQKPLIVRTNLSHLFTAYACIIVGMVVTCLTQTNSLYGFMPIGFLLTVSGTRKLSTVINHFLVHKDFFTGRIMKKYPRRNNMLGEINSSMLFLQGFKQYIDDHIAHHTVKIMASILDPDMAFLWMLGFKAGMRKRVLWAIFFFNIIVPISPLHLLFLWARIKATITDATPLRVLVQSIVISLLLVLAHYTSFWTVFWVWVFPLFYLYHIAAIAQFLSEHFWLTEVESDGKLDLNRSVKDLYNRSLKITVGRACGTRAPQTHNKPFVYKLILWIKWWLIMLVIHLPIRLFVLPGDLVCHDWHHRGQRGDNWANAPYARLAFKDNLKPGETPLIEIWGLHNAISAVFDHLSKLPAIQPVVEINESEMALGM
ncbi:fatty acid desaturase [Mucilaginibacter psychrotolerans]|uniref:Fatty acid desaturase domain-containing protein n=1 Tax=Mucilaginibacter psychrotolerans TaxID=1524096 RepID=A0A4Y8SCU7_9SPHI|nr:fatty acid desaturase [Mucilaginibacter psychrotolerans]TFF36166.1 hypothetical protein E2R66_16620 [Mucilaginibacter psychrotolerans]